MPLKKCTKEMMVQMLFRNFGKVFFSGGSLWFTASSGSVSLTPSHIHLIVHYHLMCTSMQSESLCNAVPLLNAVQSQESTFFCYLKRGWCCSTNMMKSTHYFDTAEFVGLPICKCNSKFRIHWSTYVQFLCRMCMSVYLLRTAWIPYVSYKKQDCAVICVHDETFLFFVFSVNTI